MKKIVLLHIFIISLFTLQAQDFYDSYEIDGEYIETPFEFSDDSTTLAIEAEFEHFLIEEMDTLLSLWYIHQQIANTPASDLHDDDSAASTLNDSIVIERMQNICTTIPLTYNQTVKRWIELYICKRRRSSSVMLGLTQYYYPYMREIFDKYDLPEELIYLTIIESGMNPLAVSRAGATGIWQFMYRTGKAYGLEENTFIDERRDPFKATDAAARYLRSMYNMFGDWGLAIAAYNAGPGNVRKAIARSGHKSNFWAVKPYLPKETQNYFPAFIAAVYLNHYHNQHGIPAAELTIPFDVDTVMVNKKLHLQQVAEVLNIDIDELKQLNPQYKKEVIPAYTQSYPLRLRNKDILQFIELEDSIYTFKCDSFFMPLLVYESQFTGKTIPKENSQNIYHYVKSGESLSVIAKKYGLSVTELKKMNNLRSNYLKVKQRLVVGYKYVPTEPKPENNLAQNLDSLQNNLPTDSINNSLNDSIANTLKNNEIDQKNTEIPKVEPKPETPTIYYVQRGDSLSKIAAKFNTTTKTLANYNNIKNVNALKIGQKIKIPTK